MVACGLDHQGESVLAWDAETGKPLTPIVVWQDKRSQEVLDRLADREEEIQRRAAVSRSTRTSRGKLAWLLEHDEARRPRREAGTLRMGTVDSFLCDRLGAGFATDASTASRTQLHALGTPGFDPRCARSSASRSRCCREVRDTVGELGTLRHPSWPAELRADGADRGPAGRAGGRRLRGARAA